MKRTHSLHIWFLTFIAVFSAFALSGCHPTNELQHWTNYATNQPATNSIQWLVVKCTFLDARQARPKPAHVNVNFTTLDALINTYLTSAGKGTGNLIDYYTDVSYGTIGMDSHVIGWYDSPLAKAQTNDRKVIVEACANAIPDSVLSTIDFSKYYGIIAVMNQGTNSSAANQGKYNIQIKGTAHWLAGVLMDYQTLYTASAAHEIGHGLGLADSSDDSAKKCSVSSTYLGHYCDSYDVMSNLSTPQFYWSNYPPEGDGDDKRQDAGAGPGMALPNLLQIGALATSQVVTYHVGSPSKKVILRALSRDGDYPVGIKIMGSNPAEMFTVEFRQANGWDKGLAAFPQLSNTVIVHLYRPTNSARSSILMRAGGGLLHQGDTFSFIGVKVHVDQINPITGLADVTVGP